MIMKQTLLALLMVLLPFVANAYDIQLGEIYYNLDYETKTATVAESPAHNYSGKIVIPSEVSYNTEKYNVTSIDEQAFYKCSELTSVTIPNSVTNIGDNAFYECSELTSVTLPNSITSIGEGVFCFTGLTSVTIPNSVISIGAEAFYWCLGLTSVTIPNNVTNIGKYAFAACNSLTSVNISNSVTSIAKGTFIGCSSLTSVTIPNSVISIGAETFAFCFSLTSVDIPSSVTSIGDNAFYGCSSLTSVTIPDSIITIGEQAFYGCSKVEKIQLPENLSIIKKATFKDCRSLKSITIPSTVEIIYQEAFANCTALESVKALPETPPLLYDNSFSNYLVPLKVPIGCKDLYQTAQGWKNFTNISDIQTYKLIYIVDGDIYKTYEIEEGELITPEPAPEKEGYTFSGWNEIPETMPDHDVTVTGTFSINSYKLTYLVDGEEYKSLELEFEAAITPEAEPAKEGYTFSGWSEIPTTMPAHNVTVTGTFSINSYKLTYLVDGEEYRSYELEFGTAITPEAELTKEGYTFSGWSEIPATMPAHDVTVTGSFSINSYKLTYMIDNEAYKEVMYEYGATITPEPQPEGDYARFEWIGVPETMPANDVTVYASYETGIIDLLTLQGIKAIYAPNGKKLDKPQKGLNIVIMDDGKAKRMVVK